MYGWDGLKQAKTSEGGVYVKLKDGESIEGVFAGEPYFYYQTFGDKTEYQTPGTGRALRFKINFIAIEDGTFKPMIFNGGGSIREALIDAKEEYGLRSVFKIKRSGIGKDTRYAVLFKRDVTAQEKEEIKRIRLFDLEQKSETPPPVRDTDTHVYSEDEPVQASVPDKDEETLEF